MFALVSPALLLAATLATGACEPIGTPPPAPQLSDLELVLNLPAYRLDVYADSGLVRTFGVAVGRPPRYRTPLGSYRVYSVTFNPWWYPPPGAEWAKKEKITPPGPTNPMGPAKLNFLDLYYLHGTPQEQSIGSAASHGCVRMHRDDVLELAELVMRNAGPDLPPGTVEEIERSGRTREFRLLVPVPIRIVYELAEVRRDTLLVHPDVYGRGTGTSRGRVMAALAAAGADTTQLRPAAIDSVARAGRRRQVSVPVRSLLRGEVAARAGAAELEDAGAPLPAGRARRTREREMTP